MRPRLLACNIDHWILQHIEMRSPVEHIERLMFSSYGMLKDRDALLLGFEYVTEFTELGNTLDLLRLASKNALISKVIYLSSYGVYTPKGKAFTEDDQISPMNFVGARAAILENGLMYIAERYGLDLTILRVFNTYGPFQTPPFVVPTILRTIITGGPVFAGDSENARDFLYVSDLVRAISLVLNHRQTGVNTYNIGTGKTTLIRDLVSEALEVTGKRTEVVFDATKLREEYDYDYVVADIRKAKKELDWAPMIELQEGLNLTYQWMLGRIDR